MAKPISTRLPAVIVEYDSRDGRARKRFSSAHAARLFYVQKFKQGKNPAVRRAD